MIDFDLNIFYCIYRYTKGSNTSSDNLRGSHNETHFKDFIKCTLKQLDWCKPPSAKKCLERNYWFYVIKVNQEWTFNKNRDTSVNVSAQTYWYYIIAYIFCSVSAPMNVFCPGRDNLIEQSVLAPKRQKYVCLGPSSSGCLHRKF